MKKKVSQLIPVIYYENNDFLCRNNKQQIQYLTKMLKSSLRERLITSQPYEE